MEIIDGVYGENPDTGEKFTVSVARDNDGKWYTVIYNETKNTTERETHDTEDEARFAMDGFALGLEASYYI